MILKHSVYRAIHREIVGVAGADPNGGGLNVTTSQLGPISGNCPPIRYDRLLRNEQHKAYRCLRERERERERGS